MKQTNPFTKLKGVRITELADDVSLDTLILEKEMQKLSGVDIGNDTANFSQVDDALISQFVPYLGRSYWYSKHNDWWPRDLDGNGKWVPKEQDHLKARYPTIERPCAIALENIEELAEVMSIVYQVQYFHYIAGKKHPDKAAGSIFEVPDFPNNSCGKSAESVMMSLFEFGLGNAAKVASNHNHAYVILPFVLGEIKGCIVADPTSSQLYGKETNRNAVFLKLGSRWSYKSAWRNGPNDYFPDEAISVDLLREDYSPGLASYENGSIFLRMAFANPQPLENRARIHYKN